MKKELWIGIIIVVIVVIGFFVFSGNSGERDVSDGNIDIGSGQDNFNEGSSSSGGVIENQALENEGSPGVASWMEFELTNVLTDETFKISDFSGRPILLESFAVWCPTCTAQQEELKKLHEEPGYTEDDIVSISLDTDPNEDAQRVKGHAESNGFSWYYVVSPQELTQELIDEFGIGIVSAPSAPMILICEDLSFRKLEGFGKRSVKELKDEIAAGCGN